MTITGRVSKAGQLVRAGDEVQVEVPAVATTIAEPEALPLTVLYEDATLVVVNKAPGMVVHPAPGRWQGTLVNALLHHFGPMPGSEAARPGIVHRLDRDTSGVMVIARTTTALEHLGRQFAARTVTKRYLAVVRGRLRPEVLRIDTPLGRHTTERKKMSTRARVARAAVTRVRVLERFADATLWRRHPKRAHAPDSRTRGARPFDRRRCRLRPPASARSLVDRTSGIARGDARIVHPDSGATMTFEAELWPDMLALLTSCVRSVIRSFRGIVSL